jgi:hypothetical protein
MACCPQRPSQHHYDVAAKVRCSAMMDRPRVVASFCREGMPEAFRQRPRAERLLPAAELAQLVARKLRRHGDTTGARGDVGSRPGLSALRVSPAAPAIDALAHRPASVTAGAVR